MKLNTFIKLFIFSSLLVFASCSRQKENKPTGFFVTDDLGTRVQFNSVPKRVISLAPNLTEMVYSLQMGDKLVGNTLYCNYPPAARNVAKVGDMLTVDYEKILSLKPDLILITVEGNAKESYIKLKELGFKVFVSNPRDFNGIKKTYNDLGSIFGVGDKSSDTVKNWQARFEKIVQEREKFPPVTGMFLVALNPLMLAGPNTFINELITSAGIKNIASGAHTSYPLFSREEILRRNPDFIIITGSPDMAFQKLEESYPEWKSLNALKRKAVIVADTDLYLRPGPRFIQAIEDLFAKVHPRGIQDPLR